MDSKILVLLVFNLLGAYSESISEKDYDLMPKLFHFDDFEKCLFYGSSASYCSVTVKLFPKNPKNTTKVWNIIEKVNSDKNNYRHDILRHGVCVQTQCANETVNECLSDVYAHKYESLGLESQIVKVRCETKNSEYSFRKADLVFGSLLLLYVVFVFLVSICTEIVTYQTKKDSNSNFTDSKHSFARVFFSTFSIFDNWRHLLNMKPYYEKEDFMLFLQGLRFCTIVGVVVTHALEVNVIRPVQNPRYVEEMPTRYITMILSNGGMMVQIYFVMSSFLFTISYLKKVKDGEKTHLGYVFRCIIGRFLRLTPMYAVIIGLHSTWLVHLARGPFWDPIVGEDYRVCNKNWWQNLLYINNFVINDGMCMFHSWYLSVDLQFYILGLLILWLTKKKPKTLFLAAALLIICHSVTTFCVLFWNNWEFAVILRPELMYYFGVIYSKEWQSTWTTTYSNFPGLAAGLCCGYLYLIYKNKQLFDKKINKIIWWILSWSLAFGPLLFSSYYMTTKFYSNSRLFAAIYGSINQIVYTVGCAAVLFGMAQGMGGYVKKILEWTPMHVLGQLSFGAYLVHFSILKIDGAKHILPIHVSDYLMVIDVVTNMAISYFFSAILTLFIQMPILRLIKILIG